MSDNTRGSEWLRRNAKPIRIEEAKERGTEAWQRAKNEGGGAQIEQLDDELGRYQVQFYGGDHHDLLYVESSDGSLEGAGACDCQGWRQGSPYGNVCSHIAALRQSIALDDRWDLAISEEYVDRLTGPREGTEASAEPTPDTVRVPCSVCGSEGHPDDMERYVGAWIHENCDPETDPNDTQPDVVAGEIVEQHDGPDVVDEEPEPELVDEFHDREQEIRALMSSVVGLEKQGRL